MCWHNNYRRCAGPMRHFPTGDACLCEMAVWAETDSPGPCAGLVEFEGEEYMVEPDSTVEELIDSMSTAFYSLAATGTVRVGRLCKGPQLLACWALELLEEQACHVSHAIYCSLCCNLSVRLYCSSGPVLSLLSAVPCL